jgi:hypothetical protein
MENTGRVGIECVERERVELKCVCVCMCCVFVCRWIVRGQKWTRAQLDNVRQQTASCMSQTWLFIDDVHPTLSDLILYRRDGNWNRGLVSWLCCFLRSFLALSAQVQTAPRSARTSLPQPPRKSHFRASSSFSCPFESSPIPSISFSCSCTSPLVHLADFTSIFHTGPECVRQQGLHL